jgi:F-type H+-transporting ATPase subunit delta
MSLNQKIVGTYSKSLFQNVNSFQKGKKNFSSSLEELKKFEISKIISKTDKQKEDYISLYSIGEELSLLSSLITSSKRIQTFFKNPTLPEKQKLAFLFNLFPGITSITNSFLKVLSEKSHLSLLPEICIQYNEMLAKFKKSTRVKLITANVLQENYGVFLLKTLKSVTNSNEVILTISYNPQLLGGIIVEYNSTSTDASILKEFSLFFSEI